jgi:tetratricopeptide (TPR) repeat protein
MARRDQAAALRASFARWARTAGAAALLGLPAAQVVGAIPPAKSSAPVSPSQGTTPAPLPPPGASVPAPSPGDEAVYEFLVGKIHRFDGELDDAAAHLNRAAEAEDSSAIRVALAETYLRMGDVPKAVEEAQRARQSNPSSLDARRALVEAYLASAFRGPDKAEATARAIAELKSVVEQFPAENDLRMTLARLLLQDGRTDDALEQLRAVRRSEGSDSLQAGVVLGRALLMSGRPEEAEKEFRSVLAVSPENYDSLLGLAQVAEGREDWVLAASSYEQLLALRPTDDTLRGRLGYTLMRAGRTDDAIKAFREASERAPSEQNPREMLVSALRAAGRPGEALHELDVLLEYHPQDPALILLKGQIHEDRSENELALDAYRRTAAASDGKLPEGTDPLPDNVRQQLTLSIAGLEMETDDPSAALRTLAAVPRDDSKFGIAGSVLRVRALVASHKGSAAVEEARKLAAQAQDDPRGPLLLLEARLVDASKREADEAIAEFRPESRSPREVAAAAEMLRNAGKGPQGLDLLTQAINTHPQEPSLYFAAGALNERLGNVRRAEELLEKAIELDPKHGPSLNYLGYMLADRNRDLARAEALVRRALVEDPDNGAYLDSLGWALYRQGRLDEALTVLERAGDLVAGDGTVREHLGDVYMARGEAAKALASWKTAQGMKPEDPKRLREKILKASHGER